MKLHPYDISAFGILNSLLVKRGHSNQSVGAKWKNNLQKLTGKVRMILKITRDALLVLPNVRKVRHDKSLMRLSNLENKVKHPPIYDKTHARFV